jgi:hypothetical protein
MTGADPFDSDPQNLPLDAIDWESIATDALIVLYNDAEAIQSSPRAWLKGVIHLWQVLYGIGTVTKKPGGVNFTFANWYQFLMVVRYVAKQLGVKARDVERAPFVAHKDHQKGKLYRES